MKLSIDLFKQITENLRADKSAEKGKRSGPRVGIGAEANIVIGVAEDNCRTARIQVRDISTTGIGLIVGNKMALGQKFIIDLCSEAGSFWVLCEVVYCQKLEKNMFKIGARHTKVLNPDEVKKLAARMLLAPSPTNKDAERIRSAILN